MLSACLAQQLPQLIEQRFRFFVLAALHEPIFHFLIQATVVLCGLRLQPAPEQPFLGRLRTRRTADLNPVVFPLSKPNPAVPQGVGDDQGPFCLSGFSER
jgi:hypothetical protein